MNDYLEKWKGYKDKELLREFTRFDKEELITNGDDFSVSYELELLSKEPINAESGEIINVYDQDNGYPDYTDVAGMSSGQQVRFFHYGDALLENAKENSAEEELYSQLVELEYSIRNKITKTLASLIAMVLTDGEYEEGVEISDFEVSIFAISSYLSNPLNGDAHLEFLNYAKDEESMSLFYKKMKEFNSEMEGAEGEIECSKEELRENFIGSMKKIFGMREEDWQIDKERMQSKRPEEVGKFFEFLFGKDVLNNELNRLIDICKALYTTRYPTLDDVVGARYKIERVSNSDFISEEFALAVQQLAVIADSRIDSLFEYYKETFEYGNYDITLEDYNAYDSDSGIYPEEEELEDEGTGENAFEKYLPNMWKKYGHRMEGTQDLSLKEKHHTELKFGTYLFGMNSAMEFLDDFFADFDKQDNFYFANETGLHTNIGMEILSKRFNTFKALLFLSEEERPGKKGEIPFAYKGIEGRYKEQRWSAPRKNKTFEYIKKYLEDVPNSIGARFKESLKVAYKENNVELMSQLLSSLVDIHTVNLYVKSYGLNLHYIRDRGYIEFRYPGHIIEKETLKNLTLYYGHIVKCALDPEYKKEEYIKKLYGFVEGLLHPVPEKYAQNPNQIKISKIYNKISGPYEKILKEIESTENYKTALLETINNMLLVGIFSRLRARYPSRYSTNYNVNAPSRYEFFKNSKYLKTAEDIISLDPNLKEKIIGLLFGNNHPIIKFVGIKLKEKIGLPPDEFLSFFRISLVIISKLSKMPELNIWGSTEEFQKEYSEYVLSKIFKAYLNYYDSHPEEFPGTPKEELSESARSSWIKKYERLLIKTS